MAKEEGRISIALPIVNGFLPRGNKWRLKKRPMCERHLG
jgi:hypothetical protein